MKLTVTFEEILNSNLCGAWDRFCEDTGLNPWFLNEGLGSGDEKVEITKDQAIRYGLIGAKE